MTNTSIASWEKAAVLSVLMDGAPHGLQTVADRAGLSHTHAREVLGELFRGGWISKRRNLHRLTSEFRPEAAKLIEEAGIGHCHPHCRRLIVAAAVPQLRPWFAAQAQAKTPIVDLVQAATSGTAAPEFPSPMDTRRLIVRRPPVQAAALAEWLKKTVPGPVTAGWDHVVLLNEPGAPGLLSGPAAIMTRAGDGYRKPPRTVRATWHMEEGRLVVVRGDGGRPFHLGVAT